LRFLAFFFVVTFLLFVLFRFAHFLVYFFAPSASTLLVGRQERHLACKKWGNSGGGHWLGRIEWRPAGWSVCLPLLVFPCTTKSISSIMAPAHTNGPGKRAVKRLWWWWLVYFLLFI